MLKCYMSKIKRDWGWGGTMYVGSTTKELLPRFCNLAPESCNREEVFLLDSCKSTFDPKHRLPTYFSSCNSALNVNPPLFTNLLAFIHIWCEPDHIATEIMYISIEDSRRSPGRCRASRMCPRQGFPRPGATQGLPDTPGILYKWSESFAVSLTF